MTWLPEIPNGAGLHLVLGPPNAGKLGVVLQWWGSRRGERPVIVVPTRADVIEVEIELLERVGAVFDDPPVRSVDHLVSALRPSGPPVVGDLQRSLLLRDILAEATPGGPLERLAGHPGALDALSSLLDEVGEGGAPYDVARDALGRWARKEGGALARELAGFCEAYVAGLGVVRRVDRHQALASAVEGSARWDRPVAFHGFTSFTPAQRSLVLALSARMPVVVSLILDEGRDIPGGSQEEVARLRPLALSETVLGRQPRAFSSPAVAHLECAFLREGADARPGGGGAAGDPSGREGVEGVRFLLAAGRRTEVESVAAEVVSLLRAGFRPEDIGILVRRVEPWWRSISDVFSRYGIPHRFDGSVDLASTGLGFALVSALRGVAGQDLDLLLGFLRSPYHAAGVADVDAMEVSARRAGGEAGALAAVESLLPGALDEARAALRWSGDRVVGVHAEGLLSFARGMLGAAAGGVTPGSATFEQDAGALSALARSLAEIGDPDGAAMSGGGRAASLDRCSFEAAVSLVGGLRVSLGLGDEAGVVRVTTVRRARARRFPVVFVMGLVDGEFPGPERVPGLLDLRGRASLTAADGTRLLPPERRSDDTALFALALSRPWQLLYLCARDSEDDGAEVLPSPFWSEARRLLGDPPVDVRRGLGDVVHEPARAPTEREFLRSCAAYGLVPRRAEWAELLGGLNPWACRPSSLSHPVVLRRLAAREVFSATEIEAYARCPFAWFVQRAVNMKTMEEDPGALRAGGVLHGVLRVVYQALSDAGEPRLGPPLLPGALAAAERALRAAMDDLRGGGSAAEAELAAALLAEDLRAFLTFDAHSRSLLVLDEVESSLPTGGVDLGGFRLSGRIDRIDIDPGSGAFVVVDYKSGSEVHGPDFAARGALQVPLYVLAYRRAHPGSEAGGGVYVSLRGRRRKGAVLSEVAERTGDWFPAAARLEAETLDAELAATLGAARRSVDGIRAGDISAEPPGGCPHYCTLAPLCRTTRKASAR